MYVFPCRICTYRRRSGLEVGGDMVNNFVIWLAENILHLHLHLHPAVHIPFYFLSAIQSENGGYFGFSQMVTGSRDSE